MTVDMLAATFFWPEGALIGPPPSHPDEPGPLPATPTSPGEVEPAEGFWSAMMHHLWRGSPAPARIIAP